MKMQEDINMLCFALLGSSSSWPCFSWSLRCSLWSVQMIGHNLLMFITVKSQLQGRGNSLQSLGTRLGRQMWGGLEDIFWKKQGTDQTNWWRAVVWEVAKNPMVWWNFKGQPWTFAHTQLCEIIFLHRTNQLWLFLHLSSSILYCVINY